MRGAKPRLVNVSFSLDEAEAMVAALGAAWIAQVESGAARERSDEVMVLRERVLVSLPTERRARWTRLRTEDVVSTAHIRALPPTLDALDRPQDEHAVLPELAE